MYKIIILMLGLSVFLMQIPSIAYDTENNIAQSRSNNILNKIFNGNGNTLTFNYNTAMIPPSRNMLLLSDLSIVAVQSKICTPQVIFIPLSNMRQVLSVHRTVPFPLKTVVSALLSIVL